MTQLATCVELYSRGNEVYRQGGHSEDALALYEQALALLRGVPRDSESSDGGEHAALELKLCSNAALCHLTLRNYQVSPRPLLSRMYSIIHQFSIRLVSWIIS